MKLSANSVLAGVLGGSALSVAVTSIVTFWEWFENPGGIFRSEQGTNWGFVIETAISWLWPTFMVGLVVFAGMHLLYKYLAARKTKH